MALNRNVWPENKRHTAIFNISSTMNVLVRTVPSRNCCRKFSQVFWLEGNLLGTGNMGETHRDSIQGQGLLQSLLKNVTLKCRLIGVKNGTPNSFLHIF